MSNTEITNIGNDSTTAIETKTDYEVSNHLGIAEQIGAMAVNAACGIDVSVGLKNSK